MSETNPSDTAQPSSPSSSPLSSPEDLTLELHEAPVRSGVVGARTDQGTSPSSPAAILATAKRAIGRYLVIEEVGRGGMGVVSRAYDPRLQREVALKCVRASDASASVQARMVREAQALAKINHRNVVAVYDVEVEGALVVLAMELVEGKHFGRWVEQDRPGWREVVLAYVEAGRGLQAAHEAGLLHRDFKPSNVLRTRAGEVKVIDFGIARLDGEDAPNVPPRPATSAGSSSLSLQLTSAEEVLGTPLFMAPEQQLKQPLTVAADQYAFCVSLWRSLSGSFPFPAKSFRELLRQKQEGPPPWPSAAPKIPRAVVRALARGLAFEPAARWPTMAALLDELGRDRSAQRRRKAVVGAAVLAVGAGLGWRALDRARMAEACEAEGRGLTEVWTPEHVDAAAQAFAASGLPYASDTWERARPRMDAYVEQWAAARTETCRGKELDPDHRTPEQLDESTACLDEQRVRATLLIEAWREPTDSVVRGAAAAAWRLPRVEDCTDVEELARRAAAPRDPALREQTREIRERLARAGALRELGRHPESFAIATAAAEAAAALDDRRLVAATQQLLGQVQDGQGRFEEARQSLEAAFREAEMAGDDLGALRAATHLVFTVGFNQADPEAGLRWATWGELKLARLGLGDEDIETANLLNHLGLVLFAKGQYEEAKIQQARTLSIREQLVGAHHPAVAEALTNLGNTLMFLGANDEAEPLLARALSIWEGAYGPEHPKLGTAFMNLANVYQGRGEHAKAEAASERALAILEAAFGSQHVDVGKALANLATSYSNRGALDLAEAALLRATAIFEQALGTEHPSFAKGLILLGQTQLERGALPTAKVTLDRALSISERALGPEHPDVAHCHVALGGYHVAAADYTAAQAAFERALEIRERALGAESPTVADVLHELASVQRLRGEPAQAIALAERALGIRQDQGAASERAQTQALLAELLWDAGTDRARARQLATEALAAHPEPAAVQQWLDAHP